jgi:hypothetical protein
MLCYTIHEPSRTLCPIMHTPDSSRKPVPGALCLASETGERRRPQLPAPPRFCHPAGTCIGIPLRPMRNPAPLRSKLLPIAGWPIHARRFTIAWVESHSHTPLDTSRIIGSEESRVPPASRISCYFVYTNLYRQNCLYRAKSKFKRTLGENGGGEGSPLWQRTHH